jgi:hypothetical protein
MCEARQIDQPQTALLSQSRRHAIEGAAVRQQRVQQHQITADASGHDLEGIKAI